MPWNQPGSGKGGGGDNNPWGPRGGRQGPPDLDQVIKNIQQRLGAIFGGGKSKGGGSGSSSPQGGGPLFMLIILALVLGWAWKSVYKVQSGWEGIELWFGKYYETAEPGLNFMVWPLQDVVLVNRQRVQTVEVGYRQSPDQTRVAKEALMLTKDENIVDLQLAVQFDIRDAKELVFNVAENPEFVVRGATESSLREVVGTSGMDFVLTEGRKDVVAKTKTLLQTILDRYKTGINIIAVEMQDAQPPREVKPAFDDAIKAREDQVTLQNKAEAYRNDILPRAQGKAARVRQQAEGYKQAVIAEAEGDAARFTQILQEYRKAPEITRSRLYIESLEEVLSNSSKLMIDQTGGNNILYLPLDQLIKNRRAVTVPISPDASMNMPEEQKQASGIRDSRRSTIREGRTTR